mmetsp:Transcript_70031/g.193721  ORF Transcript_70031/g.193721 Transcript_70031/m.193721 type:complete len:136 (-) Transcript_70031:125-532(-)
MATTEFTIKVDRRSEGKLGLSLELPGCRVDGVNDGLVAQWNEQNPTKQVKVGDTIVKVNGISQGISEQLAKADVLEIVFMRTEGEETAREGSGGSDPPSAKKKQKAWYVDTDTFFPVLVVFGIVLSFAVSFLLHR